MNGETRNPLLTFAFTLTCVAIIVGVIGLPMLAGFIVGVLTTLLAAALCGTEFD